jgi:ligand-binding sensor domain-containing protein
MKQTMSTKSILLQFVGFFFLLAILSIVVPLTYHETRWDISWDNVPEDIRSNYAKFRCLAVAENGDLWAGNDNGVVHINGQTWDTYSSRLLHHIRDIEVAPNGEVWVLTERNDVLRYSDKAWDQMPGVTALQDISITRDGTVWGAALNGLVQFDGTTWQSVNHSQNTTNRDDGICALDASSDGSMWLGDCSYDFILTQIDDKQTKTSKPADGVGFITKINTYDSNRVWLYSIGAKAGVNAIGYYENEQWHIYGPTRLKFAGIDIDFVTDLSADSNGKAWIATPKGVCLFNGQFCANYLKGESIYSVAVAPDGSVWVGSENQIVKLSR